MYKDKNGDIWQSEEVYKEHLRIISLSRDKGRIGFKKYQEKLKNSGGHRDHELFSENDDWKKLESKLKHESKES